MTATMTKKCRHCGAEFEASATDYTVHCRAHRTAESRRVEKVASGYRVEEVSASGRTCTVRSAVAGACGRTAVYAFRSAITGEVFAECADHH